MVGGGGLVGEPLRTRSVSNRQGHPLAPSPLGTRGGAAWCRYPLRRWGIPAAARFLRVEIDKEGLCS
jgi:hypothetical protein